METIIAATDFSPASKAALRFAIQLSKQKQAELIFYHVYNLFAPAGWAYGSASKMNQNLHDFSLKKLQNFVRSVYRSLHLRNESPNLVVEESAFPHQQILNFATSCNNAVVCIGRQGVGKSEQPYGSIVSKLLKKSTVPVIVVPRGYRLVKISKICLASGLSDLDNELDKMMHFNKHLNASLQVLHFRAPADYLLEMDEIERIKRKLKEVHATAYFNSFNYAKTLLDNINGEIHRQRPSMLVMFKEKRQTLFERLFISSTSIAFAFITRIPLMIYPKL